MELTSLADLLDLQEIDLQIDRLLDRRQSLPELEAYKEAHDRVRQLGESRDVAAGELRQIELDLDKAEGELELLEIKLGEHETRLFAGGMSGRETEHMRLEVESLRGQKDALESKVLGMLELAEPARAAVDEIQAEMSEAERQKGRLETSIKEQWKVIDAELAVREERKTEARQPIPEDLLELYERLRAQKEGVAIAAYDHGVCGGCHMALSPAEQEEAFSTDLPRCTHCLRILVA